MQPCRNLEKPLIEGVPIHSQNKALLSCRSDASAGARLGAVTFVHRFGSALNAHLHFHGCVIDRVFSAAAEGMRFHPAFLTDTAIARPAGAPAIGC
jgi:hypothetical protein